VKGRKKKIIKNSFLKATILSQQAGLKKLLLKSYLKKS
jgi:hypothetical protein